MSENKPELLPCPFCGSRNVAQGASRGRISVWCFCGAQGPSVDFPEICIEPRVPILECYALWNRRTSHTPHLPREGTERMTGTPSKDRAEAHMETGHNLSYGAVGLSRAIEFETLAIMIAIELAKAHAEGRKTGFAEGTKRAAESEWQSIESAPQVPASTPAPEHASASPGPVNCNIRKRFHSQTYPRTCERCRLGPCPFFHEDGASK